MTTIAEELREIARNIGEDFVVASEMCGDGLVRKLGGFWQDRLIAIAERAEKAPESLSTALDEYERQTKQLPYQHEIPSRGCCSYNWQMAVIRDLRRMLAAAPEPPKVQP